MNDTDDKNINGNDEASPEETAAPESEASEAAPEGGAEEASETVDGNEAVTEAPNADDLIADLKDKLLRALADAENQRRRTERQVSEANAYSVTGFARDLLAVSDNLRRALETLPEGETLSDDLKTFVEGVEMTERELLNIFERKGITKIVPEGEKFDHNFHQALFEVEDAEAAPGTIVQVVQPGYVIKDRLLRPAMVGVAKGPPVAVESVDETV